MAIIEVGPNLTNRKVGIGVVVDAQAIGSAITPIGDLFDHEVVGTKSPEIVLIVLWRL